MARRALTNQEGDDQLEGCPAAERAPSDQEGARWLKISSKLEGAERSYARYAEEPEWRRKPGGT